MRNFCRNSTPGAYKELRELHVELVQVEDSTPLVFATLRSVLGAPLESLTIIAGETFSESILGVVGKFTAVRRLELVGNAVHDQGDLGLLGCFKKIE